MILAVRALTSAVYSSKLDGVDRDLSKTLGRMSRWEAYPDSMLDRYFHAIIIASFCAFRRRSREASFDRHHFGTPCYRWDSTGQLPNGAFKICRPCGLFKLICKPRKKQRCSPPCDSHGIDSWTRFRDALPTSCPDEFGRDRTAC